MSKLSIEYLAGLFDGEGCIHIPYYQKTRSASPSYGLRVIFCLTHEEVIKRIAKHTGYTYCKLVKKGNPSWKPAYQIQLCGERAADLLREMKPFLIVKSEEVELGLRLQDHITRYRNIWKRITDDEKKVLISYREGIRLQLFALRHTDVSNGMTANSGELPCPVSNDAEGQSRAKQELKLISSGRV